ncbi:hypothetical protein ACFRKB_17840 [Streptomyces scopuliridis]|uniref:hypothetical protein n=1 Tax=Streptomyces scopuliridis TaxID=452529 RepID=UPI003678D678
MNLYTILTLTTPRPPRRTRREHRLGFHRPRSARPMDPEPDPVSLDERVSGHAPPPVV